MEAKELNIAAILEGKPCAKLWSPIIGVCALNHIDSSSDIYVTIEAGIYYNGRAIYSMTFNSRGKYGGEFKDNTIERECMLFPSKAMQDWSKFAWKKGDVLRFSDMLVIFDKWTNDDYSEFKAAFEFKCGSNYFDKGNTYYTSEFCKAIDETANNFIKKIEAHYGGKLNLSTLTIEPKSEFKDGDIVFVTDNHCYNAICIYKEISGNMLFYHAKIDADTLFLKPQDDSLTIEDRTIRIATKEEKQQLFDALAKENKVWNPETKTLEDLPKKCEFKHLDYMLVRDKSHVLPMWQLYQYAHENENYIYVVGSLYGLDRGRIEFLPYNDQTAHLLGTTDEWKGGEL